MEITKQDWKLFREKLPGWQENYMERLNREYAELLTEPGNPSDKFWALEKRIRQDKHSLGVIAEISRSNMVNALIGLLQDGAITLDDLEGFRQGMQDALSFLMGRNRGDIL